MPTTLVDLRTYLGTYLGRERRVHPRVRQMYMLATVPSVKIAALARWVARRGIRRIRFAQYTYVPA